MTDTTNTTILVIGSTGKTGKRVADQLEKRGIDVRHGSRSADIAFDWGNPQTWPAALAGVDKVYLTYYPDLAVPGSVDAVGRLTELAKDAGVSRLVLLSGRNEAEAENAERVVMASGLGWTVVRCAFFAQNFNEGAWLDEVLAGRVAAGRSGAGAVRGRRRHRRRGGGRADRRPPRRPALRADGSAPARLPRCRGGDRRGRRQGHQLRVGVDRGLLRDADGIRSATRLYLAAEPPVHRGARQQGAVGRRRAARAGTPTQGLRRLRPRGRRDGRVDAVSLNLGERISVARRESAHSDGNRARNASRSCCASNTRPRIRTMLTGGRFSLSIPRSHRRSQRFSIEATSSSNSAISPSRMLSNIRAWATSAGCAGRAHASGQ